MINNLMWFWWAATVGICAWKIIEGFLRPTKMLEWPFLASAMWAYFYGYMAYEAKISLPEYLGKDMSNIGQLMPLLCLIGIIIGWSLGIRIRSRQLPEVRNYPYFQFWAAGLFFLVVGAVGGFSVYRALKSGTLNPESASAYWYLIFYVGYPGLALCIWSLFKMEPGIRKYLWIITGLMLVAFMAPHVIDARRGPLYPAIMVLLLVPPLASRRPPNPLLFCGVLVAAALVMLLFLQIRVTTYNGGTWGEALNRIDVSSALDEKGKLADDNEYVNNCQLIWTIFGNGKYQYGTGHLSLLWHWIPRAFWKDKPSLGEGSYSFDEMFDDVEAATGFHLLGHGASAGGVADTFVQYGLLCPLFWFGLSWGMGVVYLRVLRGNSPRWLFCYVGFICASHWLVSQGFSASFVPAMCFQAVPALVFAVLGRVPNLQTRTDAEATKFAALFDAQTGRSAMTKRPIVMYLGGFARVGGIEAFARDFFLAISDAYPERELVIWGGRDHDNRLLNDIVDSGAKIFRSIWRWGCRWNLPDYLLAPVGMKAVRRAAAVVFQRPPPLSVLRALRQSAKKTGRHIPFILITSYRPAEYFRKAYVSLECENFDVITVQSEDGIRDLEAFGYRGRIENIPYFPPEQAAVVDYPCHREPGTIRLGFLGRMVTQKNLGYLLDVYQVLTKKSGRPDRYELHLFGDGLDRKELEQKCQEQALPRVEFHGEISREEIARVIDSCDIFLNTSLTEGQCLVALEVLSRGRPMVATPVGALPEVLYQRELGRLAPLEDPGAFALAIVEVESAILAGHMTPQSVLAAFQTRYDAKVILERYLNLLADACQPASER